jgi:hypothetical protein
LVSFPVFPHNPQNIPLARLPTPRACVLLSFTSVLIFVGLLLPICFSALFGPVT